LLKGQPRNGLRTSSKDNFDMSDTQRSGRPCCASGGMWRELSIMYCLRGTLTVTAECCCQQLRRLEEAIQQKRPGRRHGVILQHDNARPHIENMTKADIQELDWEILPHPPYSPDLAPSDYHLFRSLQQSAWSFLQQRR
jgi:hypothetical protein